jgi:membrane-associated phospholipid phosphatase
VASSRQAQVVLRWDGARTACSCLICQMMFPQSTDPWLVITHLGAASIMLPMLVIIIGELWLAERKSALATWMTAMVAGVAIVLASKIAFLGWGWGNAYLDFTGISGHTMLASSIFPVWMGWLLAGSTRRFCRAGVILGLAIGAIVGWSRLVLGAHSLSEVIAGWMVGMGVSLVASKVMRDPLPSRGWAQFGGMVLLFSFSPSLSGYLPTHSWEVKVALSLSGHSRPFTRRDLSRPIPLETFSQSP